MSTLNCAQGGIAEFIPNEDVRWNKQRAMHLMRRMRYGATSQEITQILEFQPADVVDQIIDEALALPLATPPEWANWDANNYPADPFEKITEQAVAWLVQWVKDMLVNGFREKMAMFWHNHFVTRFEAYNCSSYQYQYHRLLQQYALGNFKDFLLEMGKTPAMLLFLNGAQNTNIEPNENYARELYELFTLGRDNGYTQQDIQETARALTGWVGRFVFCGPVGFVEEYHDKGEKTIFGKTGNWNYEDVHRILFEEKSELIAKHLSRQLYQYFVHPQVDENIVEELSLTILANDFEIAPAIRQLFKSEHFFDEYVIGASVKSPIDLMIGFVKDCGLVLENDDLIQGIAFLAFGLGQEIFSPVDVAGWPGDRAWINNNTITGRWQAIEYFVYHLYENEKQLIVDIARHLSNNSSNVEEVSQSLVNHFLSNGLSSEADYSTATELFKIEIPQNYFDNNQWSLDWDIADEQVAFLLQHICRLPEFQLG